MDEEIQDVAADENAEVQEDTNISENSTEETVDHAAELEKQRKANAQILARAKKAEQELKDLKAKPQENKPNDPQLQDELKLIARGLSDEAIEQAKIVAKGTGKTLQEAIKDNLFITWQEKEAEKERKEKAKLGAAKGSGQTEEEETAFQSGSSRDDHLKAFKKRLGKK